MKAALLTILALLTYPALATAQEDTDTNRDVITQEFKLLEELGKPVKPHTRIDNAQEAFDFIMADKYVRQGVSDKIDQGYTDWTTTAKLLGYDGNEPIYEVRVTSSTQLPPYTCVFRFDSIGNDRREVPWKGCKYE